jgi:hypothetical protein
MASRNNDYSESIDRKTCRSICEAVGERLQRSLGLEPAALSPHLQHLIDQLRRRESGDRSRAS